MDRLRLDDLLWCTAHGKTAIRIVQHNCVQSSSSSTIVSTAQLCPRQQQYWWCAMALSGLNCPPRGTKYLPSENPISKRAANPNWWRRWRGEVGLLGWREGKGYIKCSTYPWGETTFPVGWLKGSIGVCIHGEVGPALYHNMRTNTITKDLRVQKKNTKATNWMYFGDHKVMGCDKSGSDSLTHSLS